MFYLLNKRYRLRGWQRLPYALYDDVIKKPKFLTKELFMLAAHCDGHHDIRRDELSEPMQAALDELINLHIAREAFYGESLLPEQIYKMYPCQYKREAHWSVTGKCNLRCRHCFMSAPDGKHGEPTFEQLMDTLDQLVECGVSQVGITGGEPFVRRDLLELISEIHKRGIGINCIFTNGWMLNEAFLDKIEAMGVKPPFQLSFDGVGQHDFLRGIDGCEERTLNALKLLQKRGYSVSVSTCLHKGNAHTVRETVQLMASLGVRSMKMGASLELGEWADPQLRELSLSKQEELELFEAYIPQFFEDGAPISLMLKGAFSYNKPEESWNLTYLRPCSTAFEGSVLSCASMKNSFYIGADGMIAPCMSMCDCNFADQFPNIFKTPLSEILGDSMLTRFCNTTVKEVRDKNDKCRKCPHVSKCTGGCRNMALITGDNFYDPDQDLCYFFENGWDKRIFELAETHYRKYCVDRGMTPKQYDMIIPDDDVKN